MKLSPICRSIRASGSSLFKTAAARADESRQRLAAPAGSKLSRPSCALGYVRVTGAGDQGCYSRHARVVAGLCAARRIELVAIARDVESATGDRRRRPALRWALEQIAAGEADSLVVAELRQLSHTAAGLPPLLTWFLQHGHVLIAIDVKIDTSTAAGGLAAHALTDVGRWEQERISASTRRGLAAARAGATARGRPSVSDIPELSERIRALRERGVTLKAIADLLNEEGVPTVRGGAEWRPSSVQAATGYRRPAGRRGREDLPRGGTPRAQ
jgi:DNA invertase Pin-like site-specific DNA recombinase